MYAYIKGELVTKSLGYIVIETSGGVGYKIFMSDTAINRLPNIGENVKVYTYTKVSEQELSLYGFNTEEELRMFELLITVNGVGAKSAISILSGITPSSFAMAIISDDVNTIKSLPGIGAKTAQRLILELKDKMKDNDVVIEKSVGAESEPVQINASHNSDNFKEATNALKVLGYSKQEIDNAFKDLDVSGKSIEDIIKLGLKNM